MDTRAIGTKPGVLADRLRLVLTLGVVSAGTQAGRPAARWCATCAREVEAGPVLARGSTFCSPECAMTAALPGLYLG